jgi:hypothetical protein
MSQPQEHQEQQVQHWLDVSGIRATLERYFYGLDARDATALAASFTHDAYYEANTGGGRKIVFNGATQISATLARLLSRFEASLHQGSNPSIQVDGDQATADVFAVARMVHQTDGKKVVYVRGLRYRDQLVRVGNDWRISHRIHQALWQYNGDSIEPYVPPAPGLV